MPGKHQVFYDRATTAAGGPENPLSLQLLTRQLSRHADLPWIHGRRKTPGVLCFQHPEPRPLDLALKQGVFAFQLFTA